MKKDKLYYSLKEHMDAGARFESLKFWSLVIFATIAVVIVTGEITGLTNAFINSFSN